MSNPGINCLWSSRLLSVLASLIIFLSSACVATDQRVDRNTNGSRQVDAHLPSGGDIIETDSYELAEERSVKLIKIISRKLGLAPLQNTARPEEFEFRIWTDLGGLGDPKLLGVRSNRTAHNAYFFYMDRHADELKLRREHLASPRSGWNRMLFDVRNRLTTPKGLVRDPQFPLDRDEDLILLEVVDKGEYRLVFYGEKTSFPDGRRLIEVCDYLGSEFDVNLECHGGRTKP